VLYCCALDSKEMAVTWPVLLIVYEGVFHPRASHWLPRFRPIAVSAVIAILYSLMKTQVPNQMIITPQYIPRISPSYAALQLNHYYSMLLWGQPVHTGTLIVCLAILLAGAIALRSRPMVFGLLFANLALLPLAVIPGRSGFALYIPYLGWALYAGSFLSNVIERIGGLVRADRHEVNRHLQENLASACFLLLLGGLYTGQRRAATHMGDDLIAQEHTLHAMRDAIVDAKPNLASGSRILEEDSFGAVNWTFLFLVRLAWHDATLWVDRPSQLGASFDPNDLSVYSAVVHARAEPIRVISGEPIAQEPSAKMTIFPASVNRSDAVSIEVEGSPACRLDVEYRLPGDELARSGLWKDWCTLDAAGKCQAGIDQDAERGLVEIRRIRLCGGQWQRTQASFEILP
jgi:hypothetical protein